MEAMRTVTSTTQPAGAKSTSSQSALKLPRIQIPRLEDNRSGSLDSENFKNMLLKLTAEMAPEHKIFVLKSALSGASSKLVANENDNGQALSMLSSVYGNELLQSQSKIQEFINLIHEEAVEKNHTSPNRSLWQRFKIFSRIFSWIMYK